MHLSLLCYILWKTCYFVCSFSGNGSRGGLDNVLLSGVGVGALSLLGVNSENVRSVSSGVLDSLVSSALRGLLGFNELVNLRGLLSDLFLVEKNKTINTTEYFMDK